MNTQQFSTLLVILFLLTSCNSSDDNNNGVTPESTDYEFYEDAEMVFENQGFETLSFNSGTNTVFKYFYNARQEDAIADDEYAESIYFQVDGSLNNFSYNNEELRALDLFIRRSCFCSGTGYIFPEIGTVTGTKLSNGNWDISISITFEWDAFSETDTKIIQGQFSLEPTPQ